MSLKDDITGFAESLSKRPRQPIVIWGAGSVAREAQDAIEARGWSVLAFVDGTEQHCDESIGGAPVIRPEALPHYTSRGALVAVASMWWREIGIDLINRRYEFGRDFVLVQRTASNIAWASDADHETPVFIGRRTANFEGLLAYFPLARPRHIGAYCSIAAGTRLGANHLLNAVTSHPFITHKHHGIVSKDRFDLYARFNPPITIGNDVWFGYNSCILPGVTIGNGAVIGASAVVTSDVPAYAIVVGSPAKVVRFRFSEEDIELLEAARWWTWSDKVLSQHIEDFRDPKRFFALLRKRRDTDRT